MSEKRVQATLSGEHIPTKNQIVNLANRLAVPPHAFFSEDFEILPSPIVDFRASKPKSLQYGTDASKFEYIFLLRDFLADLYLRLDLGAPEKLYSSDPDENPEQFARSVEVVLGLKSIRSSAATKGDFYKEFRQRVEKLGIFVIQDHNISVEIDGFALSHDSFTSNLIFVNSLKRNAGAKSFTLAHELAHIFGKRSAISNNYQYDNAVELYANEFAACLLIPREDLLDELNRGKYFFNSYEVARQSAERLSEVFKCSISAMLVRLERLGLSKREYTKTFLSSFGKPNFLDSDKPAAFGSKDGPKPGVIDFAYLGGRASSLIIEALEKGVTNKYEVFENTGFSKKRIEGLIEVVTERETRKDYIYKEYV